MCVYRFAEFFFFFLSATVSLSSAGFNLDLWVCKRMEFKKIFFSWRAGIIVFMVWEPPICFLLGVELYGGNKEKINAVLKNDSTLHVLYVY